MTAMTLFDNAGAAASRSHGAASLPAMPPVHMAGMWRRLSGGLLVCALLVGGVAAWAGMADLSGAVISQGMVVVDSHVKRVQHPTGGIVGEILVKDGDRVNAGDVLVRLDETQTRANLGVYTSQLTSLVARKARLAAERDGVDVLSFPAGFEAESADNAAAANGERRLNEAMSRTIEGQKAQIRERVQQIKLQMQGLGIQRDAKLAELGLLKKELARVLDLGQRRLVPETRVLASQREETRIAGEHGSIVAQIGSLAGQISELELKIISMDQTRRSDAVKELRDVEGRIAELTERKVAAEDQLKRAVVRAPQAGIVHEMSVHTVGGVVGPAEIMMMIVPTTDALTVETRIAPSDIAEVKIGQKAMLRFAAFNARTTPEVEGRVVKVSADLMRDNPREAATAGGGAAYYTARIELTPGAERTLAHHKLLPGMPVEAFLATGERSALSYMLKPLSDRLAHVFRES